MTKARFFAGMVGAGNISEFHVYAVKALPDLVELVGVTDLDAARANATAEKVGTKTFASLDALVAAGANVIHVLTPPAAHVPVALAALERGCHVLIEKPIAEDEAEGRKVSELAKKKGLTVSVNHSLLFDPQVKRALDAVRAGALGQVVSVDILRGSEYPPYAGGPLPPWYRSAGYPFRGSRGSLHVSHSGIARARRAHRGELEQPRRGPEPRLRRVARDGAVQAWHRPVPAHVERKADAEPDDHPRHARRSPR